MMNKFAILYYYIRHFNNSALLSWAILRSAIRRRTILYSLYKRFFALKFALCQLKPRDLLHFFRNIFSQLLNITPNTWTVSIMIWNYPGSISWYGRVCVPCENIHPSKLSWVIVMANQVNDILNGYNFHFSIQKKVYRRDLVKNMPAIFSYPCEKYK